VGRAADLESRAALLWLPVGAGSRVVPHTSRWWELIDARIHRRAPLDLYHAALEIVLRGEYYVIEMAPAWGAPPGDRGVVGTGPVGARVLGASRFFRYEVRCWRGGALPDRDWAVGEPRVLSTDASTIHRLLDQVAAVPTLVWGRAVGATHDMWNSNSLISWLLTTAGIEVASIHPPAGGRAPGWDAGLAVASGARA
jgi:hypothetical protein